MSVDYETIQKIQKLSDDVLIGVAEVAALTGFSVLRENASIDWTIKESVKAKLKVIVKRTLRQFGYPPDMQLLATETVLKQAEMIAKELID